MTKNKTSRNKHQGNALVLALLIVSVTSVIAYALIDASTFAVRRTTQTNQMDACRQAVHAAELHSFQLLEPPHQNEKEAKITTDSQDWTRPFEMELEDGITISGQLRDLQGQFNINLLKEKKAAGPYTPELVFSRLLTSLHIPEAQALQQNVVNWIREDILPEDQFYLEQKPPYRAAHMPLSSVTELRLIQGFNDSIVTKITPFLSALTEGNVNVNTASAEVLAALLDAPLGSARTLMDERQAYPFASNQEFVQRAMSKGIAIPDQEALEALISVDSKYFLLKSTATCKKTSLISYSLIKRVSETQLAVYQRTQRL